MDTIAERCKTCGSRLKEVEPGSHLTGPARAIYTCGHSYHPFVKPILLPPTEMIQCDECGEPVEKKTWKTKRHNDCQNTHSVRMRRKAKVLKLQEMMAKQEIQTPTVRFDEEFTLELV